MLRYVLLLLVSSALLAFATTSPAAATDGLPTTCIIDGAVFDECPLGDDGPPWSGSGGSGNLANMKPDLGARGGGFAVTPSCLSARRPFQAHAVIENFGGLDFAGDYAVQVDFYLVHPNTVGFAAANLLGSTTIAFPAGVTSAIIGEVGVLVELSGNLPDIAPGQYQLGIHIDSGDMLTELSENNNRVVAGDVVAVGDCVDLVPALDASSVSSPVTQGDTLTLAAAVRNEGDAALVGPRSFVIRYRAVPEGGDELGGTVLGEATVAVDAGATLDPGAARIAPPLSVEADLPPGNYAIGADVDYGGPSDEDGEVDEVDEDNNSALVGSIEVNARTPGPPDYVFKLAKISDREKDPISAGFRLYLTIRLDNLGGNSLPGFYPELRVVASRDEVIGSDDFTLRDFPAAQSVYSWGPGSRISRLVTLEVPWAAELAAGRYTIGVVVDPRNQVVELVDSNNVTVAGKVEAVEACTKVATTAHAQAVFETIFTSAFSLPLLPALNGEFCENSFAADLQIFETEEDDCLFDIPYGHADFFIRFKLRPAMQRACVTTLVGLAATDFQMVLDTYAAADQFKDGLASKKLICDFITHDGPKRRYCACSNTSYLSWASGPHPGECYYSAR